MDVSRIIHVEDYSNDTLLNIIDYLEASTEFEHFIYREAELDGVWRLLDMAIGQETEEKEIERLQELLKAAASAHDLVADGMPHEAAQELRQVLWQHSS